MPADAPAVSSGRGARWCRWWCCWCCWCYWCRQAPRGDCLPSDAAPPPPAPTPWPFDETADEDAWRGLERGGLRAVRRLTRDGYHLSCAGARRAPLDLGSSCWTLLAGGWWAASDPAPPTAQTRFWCLSEEAAGSRDVLVRETRGGRVEFRQRVTRDGKYRVVTALTVPVIYLYAFRYRCELFGHRVDFHVRWPVSVYASATRAGEMVCEFPVSQALQREVYARWALEVTHEGEAQPRRVWLRAPSWETTHAARPNASTVEPALFKRAALFRPTTPGWRRGMPGGLLRCMVFFRRALVGWATYDLFRGRALNETRGGGTDDAVDDAVLATRPSMAGLLSPAAPRRRAGERFAGRTASVWSRNYLLALVCALGGVTGVLAAALYSCRREVSLCCFKGYASAVHRSFLRRVSSV